MKGRQETEAHAHVPERVVHSECSGGLPGEAWPIWEAFPEEDGMHAELSSSLTEGRRQRSQMPEHHEQRHVTQLVQGAFALKSAHDSHHTPTRYMGRDMISVYK